MKSFKSKKELKEIEEKQRTAALSSSSEERRRLDFIERCKKKQRKLAK